MARRPPDLMGMTLLLILGVFLLGCVCYMAAASEASVRVCVGSGCLREEGRAGHRNPPPGLRRAHGAVLPRVPVMTKNL